LKTSYLPQNDDPLINTMLAGRYTIVRKLGEGGMGAVYLAIHNVLEKQVALKVLHGEFARKPDLVERFMQEAKSASRIRHENVIDISDFGATPEGMVFFAMELLKGHDLHDEIARARVAGNLLPWSRTKKIFLQICSALSAAHAKGIVHRDLKPENVYLVEFLGDPDFVKLLDFGIAKLTEASEDGGRKLTKTGMLFGTPEYMSPEQARGEQVDHRVDVYAMGCILFQLVTNRVPFEADNFMGVLSMHLTEPPPSIAPEVFDQIGAPRALAHVIDRALDKDRNARWQTIDDLANAVRDVCGDPIPSGTTQIRAANVASPSQTTTRRAQTPTSQPVQTVTPEGTGRVKTQWTGNLNVPEVAVDAPKVSSKLPLIVGAVVVVIGAAVVAAVALSGKHAPPAPPDKGSAVAVQPTPIPTPVPQPPQPLPQPVLPAKVKLTIDTVPHGATVIDLATNMTFPTKTPITTSLPGQAAPRQYSRSTRMTRSTSASR
jgi:serine/threonine-protein kinase